jgi:hypothetical protein
MLEMKSVTTYQRIFGKYICKSDGGREFIYEATATETAAGATWSAVVTCGGEVVGVPRGAIAARPESGYRSLLREYVESAIESRIGIR